MFLTDTWLGSRCARSLQNTFLTSSLIAVSFPVSDPTNNSSCSTVSAAEFLKAENKIIHMYFTWWVRNTAWLISPVHTPKVYLMTKEWANNIFPSVRERSICVNKSWDTEPVVLRLTTYTKQAGEAKKGNRSPKKGKKAWESQSTTAHLPCSNRHQNNTVEVEFTPLLHITCKGCTEQGPLHNVGRARQEDRGQLVSESRLPIFKQFVGLIHHQPLHTRNKEGFFSVRVACREGKSSKQSSQTQELRTHTLLSGKASCKAGYDKDSPYLVKSIAGGSCFNK